jgi:hypothetical protein
VPAFVPETFSEPVVCPDTASLFRRAPYISPAEYQQTPTAVGIKNLVPGGTEPEQLASLAAVISRASDWVDTICFHRADGTLAASPSTESGWVRPKDDDTLQLICNYKPILEVDGLAIGTPGQLSNIGDQAAQTLSIQGTIIQLPGNVSPRGATSSIYPSYTTVRGKVYAVWVYVSGYPHTALAKAAKAKDSTLEVTPSIPDGSNLYGVYPGTQLTIHDGANTEVIVVASVAGLTLNLAAPLVYAHTLPAAPNTTRVTAIPWIVEQATISLVSNLIKMRGTRALVIPSSPAKAANPPKQSSGQAGAQNDYDAAVKMLEPFTSVYMRST